MVAQYRLGCSRRMRHWEPFSGLGSELTMRELVVLPAEPHCKMQYNQYNTLLLYWRA
jgi:hypothetical protein